MDDTKRAPKETATRVRYSRISKENRTPKNTLVTVRDGDTVYFGIARCNRKLDTFHKNIGTYIANQRAQIASDDGAASSDYSVHVPAENVEFSLHRSGLRGCVCIEDVREVVNYFRGIDEYCLDTENKSKKSFESITSDIMTDAGFKRLPDSGVKTHDNLYDAFVDAGIKDERK